MSETRLRLAHAPIIEAVVDIECDMPPGLNVTTLESPARERYRDQYPKIRTQFLQGFQVEQGPSGDSRFQSQRAVQGYQVLHEDERQLVQVRAQGFSFNRLTPYGSFDDYRPEIERTWKIFVEIASPVSVRGIKLRYINRMKLPLVNDQVDLDDYLAVAPHLPAEDRLGFTGFLNHHAAIERETGNRVNIVLAVQPKEQGTMPLILDIEAYREETIDPRDWETLAARLEMLRELKNEVFAKSLTEKCMALFR